MGKTITYYVSEEAENLIAEHAAREERSRSWAMCDLVKKGSRVVEVPLLTMEEWKDKMKGS